MGDYDNLTAWATRRDRLQQEVRDLATSREALNAWDELAHDFIDTEREAFTTGFDLGRDSAPTDYARIAVLQTEREHIRRELNTLGNRSRTGGGALIERYDAIDKEIREAIA